MRIKRLKLEMLAKIQPQYSNAYGAYDEDSDTIYVDIDLPKKPIPSAGAVLQHERAHALLCKAKVKLRAQEEERFCELFALASTPPGGLTQAEAIARDLLWPGLAWKRAHDRSKILFHIVEQCAYEPTPALVDRLLSLIP